MMNWGITSREVVFGSQRASVGRKEDDSDVKDQTEGEDPAGRREEASTSEPGGEQEEEAGMQMSHNF